jgi:hypothetical protein
MMRNHQQFFDYFLTQSAGIQLYLVPVREVDPTALLMGDKSMVAAFQISYLCIKVICVQPTQPVQPTLRIHLHNGVRCSWLRSLLNIY